MVEIPDRAIGELVELPPLPPYKDAREILADALPALAPPVRVDVAKAAAEIRRIDAGGYWTRWANDVAPYMVEPMEQVTSRRYGTLAFAGPARSVKTAALIENTIAHAVKCSPRPVRVIAATEKAAREFSIEKLGPMIRHSPELAARQLRDRGGDNLFEKRFRGGMRLTVGWPVISQLSMSTIALMLLTELDRMPDDIDGEGAPLVLARKRTQTYGSAGMVVVECSPGRPILDEGWRPRTPHEAPPTTGILAAYNEGTRGRFYWACPGCGEEFEPKFDLLTWPDNLPTPAEKGAAAYMVAPCCGQVIEQGDKRALNAAGRWLHEGPEGKLVGIDEGPRATDTVSYWLTGPAAVFAPWAEIVSRVVQAREKADQIGDETDLKSVTNLDLGLPYLPRALEDEEGLNRDRLVGLAGEHPLGEAPPGARFITVSVDVQATRFPCQVDAWGPELERWMIDRFDIKDPPEDAPRAGARALDPAKYDEDWGALLGLIDRAWPVTGTGYALKPLSVIIDSHGAKGATPRAYRFWRGRRAAGQGKVWHLVRGEGGLARKRAVRAYPETAHGGKKAARDVPVIRAGTDLLKDEIRASLLREDAGARAYHLSRHLPDEVFEELAAERRTAKGWQRRPGFPRNEAMDLSVYGLALAIVLKAEKIDWAAPPAWAGALERNPFAVALEDRPAETAAPAPAERPAPVAPERRSSLKQSLKRARALRRSW